MLVENTTQITCACQYNRVSIEDYSIASGGGLFCPQIALMYTYMDCDDQVQFILRPMTLEQKAICGLQHTTGQELLYLDPPRFQAVNRASKVCEAATIRLISRLRALHKFHLSTNTKAPWTSAKSLRSRLEKVHCLAVVS